MYVCKFSAIAPILLLYFFHQQEQQQHRPRRNTYTHMQMQYTRFSYVCFMYTHVLCMLFSLHRTRTNLSSSRFDDCCCCCRFFFFVHLRRLYFSVSVLLIWHFSFNCTFSIVVNAPCNCANLSVRFSTIFIAFVLLFSLFLIRFLV